MTRGMALQSITLIRTEISQQRLHRDLYVYTLSPEDEAYSLLWCGAIRMFPFLCVTYLFNLSMGYYDIKYRYQWCTEDWLWHLKGQLAILENASLSHCCCWWFYRIGRVHTIFLFVFDLHSQDCAEPTEHIEPTASEEVTFTKSVKITYYPLNQQIGIPIGLYVSDQRFKPTIRNVHNTQFFFLSQFFFFFLAADSSLQYKILLGCQTTLIQLG